MKKIGHELEELGQAVEKIKSILSGIEMVIELAMERQRGLNEAEKQFVKKAAIQSKRKAKEAGGRPEDYRNAGRALHKTICDKLGWGVVVANEAEIVRIMDGTGKGSK